ncbi:hypothetical protein BLA29_011674, partial [Euroglyphus maynei]
ITEPYRLTIENRFESFINYGFNGDRFVAGQIFSIFISIIVYWIVSATFMFIDIYQWPKFILKYKIRTEKSPKTVEISSGMVKQVLINQMIAQAMFFFFHWFKMSNLLFPQSSTLPTLSRFITEWISFILIREITFYYTHRLCHHPYFYRHIHKRHHEFQA